MLSLHQDINKNSPCEEMEAPRRSSGSDLEMIVSSATHDVNPQWPLPVVQKKQILESHFSFGYCECKNIYVDFKVKEGV